MDNFGTPLHAIERLKEDGVVTEYAIGGAMALVFWAEPIPTFDIDVFVHLRSEGPLLSRTAVYEWARSLGYPEDAEHVIAGIPVQVIPAPDALAEEAISNAAELEYEWQHVRVIRPEFHRDVSATGRPIGEETRTRCCAARRWRVGSPVARLSSSALQVEVAFV